MADNDGTQSGAAGTDSNAQGGNGTTGQTGTDANDSNGTGTQSGTESNAGSANTVSREDYEAIQRRMQAADKRAADFEKRFTEAERAKMDETERTKAELADATQKIEALTETNRKLSLDNAFLVDNTYKWKDSDAAMKLADLSGVTIGEDGKAIGLKEALKALADSKKWLLDDTSSSDGEGQGEGQQKQTRPPVNTTVGAGTGNGSTTAAGRNSMESRFPQLSGRVQ